MAPSSSSTSSRAVDVLVYAPVGMASLARDFLPGFVTMCVSRGRTEIQGRQALLDEQLERARDLGRTAASHAPDYFRGDLSTRVDAARAKAQETLSSMGLGARSEPESTKPAGDASATRESASSAASPNGDEAAKGSSDLPIPDYDALAATQVVDRLAGLEREELEAIRAYETSHRARKTILGKIEQLTG